MPKKRKRVRLARKKIMLCENCSNCTYTGEGDYVCMADRRCPIWVKEDWEPTSEYFFCGGEKWEEGDSA